MADKIPAPNTGNTVSQGNFLSQKVFKSEDFSRLQETYDIGAGPVAFDVSVPMLDDRPALDDTLLKTGQTHKERVELGIGLNGTGGIVVSLSGLYASASRPEVKTFKPPVISDVTSGVFALSTEHQDYMAYLMSLERDGHATLVATDGADNNHVLFDGRSVNDPDYERLINYFERMLTIPFADGGVRRPKDS